MIHFDKQIVTDMVKVKIVVIHYGEIEVTCRCLQSLKRGNSFTNIVVVNNTEQPIENILKLKFPRIFIVNNKRNLGFAKACNIGIRVSLQSNPKYIFIVNNDTVIPKNTLNKLIQYAKRHQLQLVSPKILEKEGNLWFAGGEIDKNRFTAGHKKGKTDYLSGCCMLIATKVFDKIGFFDEKYFMYYEDADFCYRAKKAHFQIGIDKKVTIYHHTHHTGDSLQLMKYYLAKNHFLFVKKHAPLFIKIREIIRLPKTLWEHYQKKEFEAIKGIQDFFSTPWYIVKFFLS